MINFEIAEHTDQCIDELEIEDDVKMRDYIVVNHSALELPKMLYANELISNESITIQFDYWIGNSKCTHLKQFVHPPYTRRHLARIICSELKHIYGIHCPGWSIVSEMHLKGVELKNNIYVVEYYTVVI